MSREPLALEVQPAPAGAGGRGNAGLLRPVTALFLLLAAGAVLLVAGVAIRGRENLLLHTAKDDGFYYLKLAQSMARGGGPSFDGLGPTNGFHPLWALLLTPIFWLPLHSPDTPIRLQLLLGLSLHLAAAWAVFRAAREICAREAAVLAGLCYAANPVALYLVISGMESPLAGFLVALLTRESILRRKGAVDRRDRGAAVRLGLLLGLCCLARTDLVLLSGLVFLGAALPPWPASPPGGARGLGALLRPLVLPAVIAAAVIAPWVAWNLLRFGSIVQVSARAHHLHSLSTRAAGEAAGLGRFLHVGGSLFAALLHSIAGRTGVPFGVILLLAAAAPGIFGFWILSLLRDPQTRRDVAGRILWCAPPAAYALGFLGATFFVLGHIRSWYLAGPLAVGGVLLALPAHYAVIPLLRRPVRAASALVFLGLTLGTLPLGWVFAEEIIGNASRPHCWREAADWVAQHTSPDDRVASFNSGAFGYLAPRTVVNLDCVVNNRALPYLERRELLRFLRENRIRYVIDDPAYIRRYFTAYAGPGWQETVAPVDTLRTGLVVCRVLDQSR